MKYFKKLSGSRVYLSPMCPDDAPKYTEWFCNSHVTDGIGATQRLVSVESERAWLQSSRENNHDFSIILQDTNELIGNCSLQSISQINQCAEIGIFIGDEENRNRGLGTEALRLILDYAFNTLNLHNIELGVFSFNSRAIRCYEKIGFKKVGVRRECYYLNGKFHDRITMDILKSEFIAQ